MAAEGETEMSKVAVISVNAAAAPAEHKKAQASLSEIFSFADKTDCILIFFGVIGAGVNGAAMPVFSIFFGDILDSVGEQGAHSKPMPRLRPHDDTSIVPSSIGCTAHDHLLHVQNAVLEASTLT